MSVLLLVVAAWAGLIEPIGGGRDDRRSSPPPRSAPRSEPIRPAPAPPRSDPAPAARPSDRGAAPAAGQTSPLIVPAPQNPAPAPQTQFIQVDPNPPRHWRRYRHWYWDPYDHYWYRFHHGYWWYHHPVQERWVVYEGQPVQNTVAVQAGPVRSADGRRLVEVTNEGEAFLYDASVLPPRLMKRLEGGVQRARFSSEGYILLELRDGTIKLYDAEGRPAAPPSGTPPAKAP